MKTSLFCSLLVLCTAAAVTAQWEQQRDPRVPSLQDGKPNLSAPALRASDGKPDLSGVWLTDGGRFPLGTPTVEGDELRVSRHFINVTADMKPDQVQMEPWAAELFKNIATPVVSLTLSGTANPQANQGRPKYLFRNKIIQTPLLILVLYEENSVHRQIFMDGRKPVATRSRAGTAIRAVGGRETRWSSKLPDSTTGAGSIAWDILTQRGCA